LIQEDVMKKRLVCWLMATGSILVFSGCEKAGDILREVIQTPDVSLSDLMVTGISSQRLDLSAKLAIDNPNPVGLYLSSLEYALDLAGNPLFSGVSEEGLDIEPSGASFAEIPISLGYKDVKMIYDSVRGQDEVPYRLTGKVKLDTPIGPVPVPFDIKGNLPVVRPPKIKSVDLKLESLSLSNAELALTIKLFNPNNFALDISQASYALELDGKHFSEGGIEAGPVSAKSEACLKIPLSINLISLGSWAYSLIRGGSTDYELSYDARYYIKDWPVRHEEKKAGTLNIR
jgi:LEA14-like dessication related protein